MFLTTKEETLAFKKECLFCPQKIKELIRIHMTVSTNRIKMWILSGESGLNGVSYSALPKSSFPSSSNIICCIMLYGLPRNLPEPRVVTSLKPQL